MIENNREYYKEKLSAERLKKCYDIAPPRVMQYFREEIKYVKHWIDNNDIVLELGCGYGRILPDISLKAEFVIGIDNSKLSLKYGIETIGLSENISLNTADALYLPFKDEIFDKVICIQNGISAFQVDPVQLIDESIRVVKTGGTVLFSTYSEKFWKHRLEWFELQANEGLLGEIDHERTGDGEIVCKDGFKARTFAERDFLNLIKKFKAEVEITEVDNSSLFCVIRAI